MMAVRAHEFGQPPRAGSTADSRYRRIPRKSLARSRHMGYLDQGRQKRFASASPPTLASDLSGEIVAVDRIRYDTVQTRPGVIWLSRNTTNVDVVTLESQTYDASHLFLAGRTAWNPELLAAIPWLMGTR